MAKKSLKMMPHAPPCIPIFYKKIIIRKHTDLKGKYLDFLTEAKATEKSDLSVTDSTGCHAM